MLDTWTSWECARHGFERWGWVHVHVVAYARDSHWEKHMKAYMERRMLCSENV